MLMVDVLGNEDTCFTANSTAIAGNAHEYSPQCSKNGDRENRLPRIDILIPTVGLWMTPLSKG